MRHFLDALDSSGWGECVFECMHFTQPLPIRSTLGKRVPAVKREKKKKSIYYSCLAECHRCRQQAQPGSGAYLSIREKETEASGVKAGALNSLFNVFYTLRRFKNSFLQGAPCNLDDLLQCTRIYIQKKHPSQRLKVALPLLC